MQAVGSVCFTDDNNTSYTQYVLRHKRRTKFTRLCDNQICSSFRAVIALFLLSLTHPGESGGSRANLFYLVAQIRCCLMQSIKPRKHGKHIVDSKLAPDSAAERAKRAIEDISEYHQKTPINPYAPKGNRVNEIVYTILYRMIQMLLVQQR